MGVTFYCLSGYDDNGEVSFGTLSWDMNFAGHEVLGQFLFYFKLEHMQIVELPYAKSYANANDATRLGNLISNLTDASIEDFFNLRQNSLAFDGGVADFICWIRQWQDFLLKCKGYSCPNAWRKPIKRIVRDRLLTPEEADEDCRIRELVEKDLPDLIKQHHERMEKK